MKQLFLALFTILFFNKAIAMKNSVIPNGVYLKISGDVIGWHTIVGPDVIIVKDKCVKLLYLHDNLSNDYILNDHNQLYDSNNENNDNSHLVYNQSLELSLVYQSFMFNYIQLNASKIKSDKNILEKRVFGSWLSTEEIGIFNFDKEIDSHTNEYLLNYNHNEINKPGRWSIFVVDGFVILEIRFLDTSRKQLMVLVEINQSVIKSYYLDNNGIEKWVVFNRL